MFTDFSTTLRQHALPARPLIALALAASLAGCINSPTPILTGAKPQFGNEARFQFFDLEAGGARHPQRARYRWDGSRYVFADGDFKDTAAFTIHPLAGRDFIVQSTDARSGQRVDYALARRLAEGVFLLVAIDENDADAASRAEFCAKGSTCRIATREALMTFARATAAKPQLQGGLALQMAPDQKR